MLWQVASLLPSAPSAREEEAFRQMKGEVTFCVSQASEPVSSFGNCPAPESLHLAFQGCPAPTHASSLQVRPLHELWEPIKTVGVCDSTIPSLREGLAHAQTAGSHFDPRWHCSKPPLFGFLISDWHSLVRGDKCWAGNNVDPLWLFSRKDFSE